MKGIIMKRLLITSFLILAGCSPSDKVQLLQGPQGVAGANGHSLVSQFMSATELECANGGTRLDVYLDMDDSLTVTEGDLYQGSLVACNGSNGVNGVNGVPGAPGPQGEAGPQGLQGIQGAVGPQGEQGVAGPAGPQGPTGFQGLPGATGAEGPPGEGATVGIIAWSQCTNLTNGFYGKTGNNVYSIYTSSNCSGQHNDLNSANPTQWITANELAVFASPNTIRTITFN